MEIVTNGYGNNDQTVETEVAKFLIVQRNYGYVENDGRWVVSQLPELYWTITGSLRQRRPGKTLGIFDSPELAIRAIEDAEAQEIQDKALN